MKTKKSKQQKTITSIPKLYEDIKNSKKIALFCHENADADAICSIIALKNLIEQNFDGNKTIDLFVPDEKIDLLYNPIIETEQFCVEPLKRYDFAIACDCASIDRLGKWGELFGRTKNTCNIDHHISNTRFAKNNLVGKCSSTGEFLYFMASLKGLEISNRVCILTYISIVTDTNNLTGGDKSTRTFNVLSKLFKRNVDYKKYNEYFFKNNTQSKTGILQKALSSLSLVCNNQIALLKINKTDLATTGATFVDTMGIVDYGINIKDVCISIIFIKNEDNSYYVSMRGKNGVDVSVIAEAFGGGGHIEGAGFTYAGNLSEFKDKLLKECKKQLKEINTQEDFYDFWQEY